MAWDEGKFFDNLNCAKNRLQENPHLTEIERETYLAAFAELQMYLLNTSGGAERAKRTHGKRPVARGARSREAFAELEIG